MKAKTLITILIGAFVLAGIWFGRLAWRAHNHIVSLHVRNAPLAEVVRSIERQTWERIKFDQRLNAKITLNVTDAPLEKVLDAISAKCGARWERTFAVYSTESALQKLEASLRGEAKLTDAGWTNIAPHFAESKVADAPMPAGAPIEGKPGQMVRRVVSNATVEGASKGRSDGGNRITTFMPDGTVEQWSSERLVLEAPLNSQLGTAPAKANPETAAQTAAAVHGRSRLYYVLEKAPFAMGNLPRMRFKHLANGRDGKMPPGDIGATLAQEQRNERLRELSNSPEEQVERARQKSGGNMRFESTEDVK